MWAWRKDNVPQEGENGCSREGIGWEKQTVVHSADESALKAAQLPKHATKSQKRKKPENEQSWKTKKTRKQTKLENEKKNRKTKQKNKTKKKQKKNEKNYI